MKIEEIKVGDQFMVNEPFSQLLPEDPAKRIAAVCIFKSFDGKQADFQTAEGEPLHVDEKNIASQNLEPIGEDHPSYMKMDPKGMGILKGLGTLNIDSSMDDVMGIFDSLKP